MISGLAPATLTVVRHVWSARLGVPPQVFDADEPVFVDRQDLTAVVAVRLGGTTVIAAPGPALSAVQGLPREHLLDADHMRVALQHLRPRLLGNASLSFADRSPGSVVMSAGGARLATSADVATVAARCSDDEWEESGLWHMGLRWVVLGADGEADAAAGYEVWADGLAHIGLAVARDRRGQGLGTRAAVVAVAHAIDAGLIPQWRCRLDNATSRRVSERLGFVRVGEQLAIDVDAG